MTKNEKRAYMKVFKRFLIILLVFTINLVSTKDVYAFQRYENEYWVYYVSENHTEEKYDPNKVGKWMYFFTNKNFIDRVCLEAVERGIVNSAKYNNKVRGIASFYINGDDLVAHKRVLNYFLKRHLIPKGKYSKFRDISFEFDSQTLFEEYGNEFQAKIKLSDFIDLETGNWLEKAK